GRPLPDDGKTRGGVAGRGETGTREIASDSTRHLRRRGFMTWGTQSFVLFLLCVPRLMAQGVVPGLAPGMDPEWRPKLSQPQYEDIRFRMSQVPMPDGTKIGVA